MHFKLAAAGLILAAIATAQAKEFANLGFD